MRPELYYLVFAFFASLMAALTAVLTVTREARRGRWALALGLLASAWWAFFEGVLFFSGDLELKLYLTRIQYFGIVAVPPLLFFYMLDYIGALRTWRRSIAAALAVVPVVTLILVWTNPAHHLMWSDTELIGVGDVNALRYDHGPFFWAYTLYNYVLLLSGAFLVFRAFLQTRSIFRRQFGIILGALVIPLIGNVLYLFDVISQKPFDFTAIAFAGTTIVLAAGFFYFKLQDVMPIAKDLIFANIPDGVMVLDQHHRIIYVNRGLSLPLDRPGEYFGKPVTSLYSIFPRLDRVLQTGTADTAVTVGDASGEREFDVRVSALHDHQGEVIGKLLVFRDITERMRLEGELRRIATTDELTGLLNRREFLERAEREFSRSLRYGSEMSVLLIDIDRFKNINDEYGHAAGDEALRKLARAGDSCVRATDIFGRLGGDEFAVLLLETAAPDAVELAERVRTAMSSIELETERGMVSFTVSIGVATRGEETSLDELISHADRSLYRAKRGGRDRVDAS